MAFQNIFQYSKSGVDDLATPVMDRLFWYEGIAGMHGTPRPPLFVYHSVND